jgi:hypothetical protein
MKAKIAIGILIIFCFTEIRPLLPFLEYYVNYDYISEVLCINKEKPILGCNGKCYLNKQIKKTQESEKQEKKILPVTLERIPMILYSYEIPKLAERSAISKKHFVFYQFSTKDLTLSPPTPPPKC